MNPMNHETQERTLARSRGAEASEPFVMIAEDDAELRGLLAAAIAEDGYVVRTAADGRELLAMLTAVSRREMPMPSMIVMDVRMPRCSGIEVLTALRLADWTVPVAIITGFGDEALHGKARTLGAAVVLDKPFEIDALRDVVRALCLPPTAFASNDSERDEATVVMLRRALGGGP